jgi:peptidoglycan/LPS O-acetylase OafA/YrhL
VQLGVWSYAFYLLHQLVIRAVVLVAFDGRPRGTVAGWVATALALGLAVAAAAILFVLVERPLDRRLRGDGRAPTRG